MKFFLVLSVLLYLGAADALVQGQADPDHHLRLSPTMTRGLGKSGVSKSGIVSAKHGRFPYVLSLQAPDPYKLDHWCACILLDEKTVLSTASCVLEVIGLPKFVVAGAKDIHVPDEYQQVREVVSYSVHPKLQLGCCPKYDFALLSLNASFNLDQHVAPVPEFYTEPEVVHENCVVAGWSNLVDLPLYELQAANVTVLGKKACEDLLQGWGYPAHETNLCVGVKDEAAGWVEIGGPLVCDGKFVGLTGLPIVQLVYPGAPIIAYNVGVNGTWVNF